MAVRNRGLLALSALLLAGAASLAAVLAHDGIGVTAWAGGAGDGPTTWRGTLTPFAFPPDGTPGYGPVFDVLQNHTYVLRPAPNQHMSVIVTSPVDINEAGTVVVTGDVLWTGPHPDGLGRTLVVVGAKFVTAPILFR